MSVYRRYLTILLCVHVGFALHGAWVHSPAIDEFGHIAAGISHWKFGNFDLFRVNPPIARLVAAAPIMFWDWDLNWHWYRGSSVERVEFYIGDELWKTYGDEMRFRLFLCRIFNLAWSILTFVLIARWTRDWFGIRASLFSTTLWAFSPFVLANAQVVSSDMCATATGLLACYVFANDRRDHSACSGIKLGFYLGLALVSKFTWIVLPIVWLLTGIVFALSKKDVLIVRSARNWIPHSLIVTGIAVLVINAAYGFEGTCRSLGMYEFTSKWLRGSEDGPTGNRFRNTLLEAIPVPLPANFLLGIDRQKLDFESGKKSYMRGQWRDRGWLHYYLYAYLVKEPLGMVILTVWGFWTSIVTNGLHRNWHILAGAVCVVCLVSSQVGINHHLRYVLPSFPFLVIATGSLWRRNEQRHSPHRTWPLQHFLISSTIASVIWGAPHFRAYFGILGGGTKSGHWQLLDSNVDWGQDGYFLSQWICDNAHMPLDGVIFSVDFIDPVGVLGRRYERPPQFAPEVGRYAVFVHRLHDPEYRYFLFFQPTQMITYSIHLYEISKNDVARFVAGQ